MEFRKNKFGNGPKGPSENQVAGEFNMVGDSQGSKPFSLSKEYRDLVNHGHTNVQARRKLMRKYMSEKLDVLQDIMDGAWYDSTILYWDNLVMSGITRISKESSLWQIDHRVWDILVQAFCEESRIYPRFPFKKISHDDEKPQSDEYDKWRKWKGLPLTADGSQIHKDMASLPESTRKRTSEEVGTEWINKHGLSAIIAIDPDIKTGANSADIKAKSSTDPPASSPVATEGTAQASKGKTLAHKPTTPRFKEPIHVPEAKRSGVDASYASKATVLAGEGTKTGCVEEVVKSDKSLSRRPISTGQSESTEFTPVNRDKPKRETNPRITELWEKSNSGDFFMECPGDIIIGPFEVTVPHIPSLFDISKGEEVLLKGYMNQNRVIIRRRYYFTMIGSSKTHKYSVGPDLMDGDEKPLSEDDKYIITEIWRCILNWALAVWSGVTFGLEEWSLLWSKNVYPPMKGWANLIMTYTDIVKIFKEKGLDKDEGVREWTSTLTKFANSTQDSFYFMEDVLAECQKKKLSPNNVIDRVVKDAMYHARYPIRLNVHNRFFSDVLVSLYVVAHVKLFPTEDRRWQMARAIGMRICKKAAEEPPQPSSSKVTAGIPSKNSTAAPSKETNRKK